MIKKILFTFLILLTPFFFAEAQITSRTFWTLEGGELFNGNRVINVAGCNGCGSGGGGSSTFTGLTDTPSSFSGQAGNALVVNQAENALIFEALASGMTYGGAVGGGGNDEVLYIGPTGNLTSDSNFTRVSGNSFRVNARTGGNNSFVNFGTNNGVPFFFGQDTDIFGVLGAPNADDIYANGYFEIDASGIGAGLIPFAGSIVIADGGDRQYSAGIADLTSFGIDKVIYLNALNDTTGEDNAIFVSDTFIVIESLDDGNGFERSILMSPTSIVFNGENFSVPFPSTQPDDNDTLIWDDNNNTLVWGAGGGGGQASLTETFVGFGDASNELSGSADFTYSGGALTLSGNNSNNLGGIIKAGNATGANIEGGEMRIRSGAGTGQANSSMVFEIPTRGSSGSTVQSYDGIGMRLIDFNGPAVILGNPTDNSVIASLPIANASPANSGILGTWGVGENVKGGDLTISAGFGTGNATASKLSILGSMPRSSGTDQQAGIPHVVINWTLDEQIWKFGLSATGTDIGNLPVFFNAPDSTGSADGGDFVFRVTPGDTAGSNKNDYEEAFRIFGNKDIGINGVRYTFPSSDGTTGQVLTTNGSGSLVWGTVSGGGATWGSIGGTLADQTDLNSVLSGLFPIPAGTTSQVVLGDGTLGNFTFTGLADTPANYSGAGDFIVKVDSTGTGLVFENIANVIPSDISAFNNDVGYITGVPWGNITGTLSSQSDLVDAIAEGGIVKREKIEISSAEILDMNTTPIELLPAPGAGFVLNVHSILINYQFGTVAYDTNTTLGFVYTSTNTANITNLINQTASELRKVGHVSVAQENFPLSLISVGGDPLNGDGTLDVFVEYTIIEL